MTGTLWLSYHNGFERCNQCMFGRAILTHRYICFKFLYPVPFSICGNGLRSLCEDMQYREWPRHVFYWVDQSITIFWVDINLFTRISACFLIFVHVVLRSIYSHYFCSISIKCGVLIFVFADSQTLLDLDGVIPFLGQVLIFKISQGKSNKNDILPYQFTQALWRTQVYFSELFSCKCKK